MALTRRKILATSFSALVAAPVLAACGTVATSGGTNTDKTAPGKSDAPVRLRIGDLPLIDMLPIYAADADGVFAEKGLQIELVPFSSAVERDAAYTSNQIDGELNDVVSSTALAKNDGFSKIVRVIIRSTPQRSMFYVLVSKESGVETVADLADKEIAISHNSIIEYLVDKMLTTAGLAEADIKKLEVSRIPLRLEMLSNSQVPAALLPEPLATLAVEVGGARSVLDDSQTRFGASMLSFRRAVLENQPDAVRTFMEGFEEGVRRVNTNPEQYRTVMEERANIPQPVRGKLVVPTFPAPEVPTREELADVAEWAMKRGIISEPIPYEQMVDDRFLITG